ncbi:carbon-phosphorus lyase complex subunit PhnI [Bradyrhizobium sacchari]|uniref:Alpha-D-ribose 1-methylphosphonate 5-triphosphate synthase subunit PhnI n=1 Tax=Bradyrhizobium sacchari TaxID=1399419 RepID=A0A560KCE1_9BRAD|nr:carbon-phosphorus lyase complex subunit PhnI [Bradyrhizobium sacchari]OPY94421.1 carbon-phosphorus lyase complex subunit PhnI [Bradyrhizobium sacchari]TWB64563.1 alpha-D-ribose 1-methylphosphonate 5-triphosphate synthase subunit PhnI [Bradyrhizobium sacchari]TWB80887.1 alpha-D-ribose 1-methylphosphonate 5-triphosphate synthase subunit PhnI [Bradyrhizobium sacchari]
MITSIKGGEAAIAASHRLLAKRRRGDPAIANLSVGQIREQLSLAVDRVMSEGSLYDPELAALAIKQAEGDLVEAIYLLRAFRTTLTRFGHAEPIDTAAMIVRRRIATTHKDVPGGQLLGPTYDYTHRMLDIALMGEAGHENLSDLTGEREAEDELENTAADADAVASALRRDCGVLARTDLVEPALSEAHGKVADITRAPVMFPSRRDERLQSLARGDEGFLMGLCYSTMRGYGRSHPFIAELRYGDATVVLTVPELDISVGIGAVRLTECQTVHLTSRDDSVPPRYTRGYGLVLGHGERKAISMAMLDRTLRSAELGETVAYPAQDDEFVLSHCDSVAASGLVQHLKLPHYVDFQAELQLLSQMRADYAKRRAEPGFKTADPATITETLGGD